MTNLKKELKAKFNKEKNYQEIQKALENPNYSLFNSKFIMGGLVILLTFTISLSFFQNKPSDQLDPMRVNDDISLLEGIEIRGAANFNCENMTINELSSQLEINLLTSYLISDPITVCEIITYDNHITQVTLMITSDISLKIIFFTQYASLEQINFFEQNMLHEYTERSFIESLATEAFITDNTIWFIYENIFYEFSTPQLSVSEIINNLKIKTANYN